MLGFSFINRKRVLSCAAVGAALVATGSSAQAVIMTYNLGNHPNGGIRLPFYGLRLDGLDGDNSKEFTFDFDRPEITTPMKLTLDSDADTVRIHGQVYGGEDIWTSKTDVPADPDDYYANDAYRGLWDVDFTYSGGITFEFDTMFAGSVSVVVNAEDHTNHVGTIERVGNPALKYVLQDEQGSHAYSFKFNNIDNHRLGGTGLSGPDTFVGWGWVNHAPAGTTGVFPHVYASDWLFTGTRAPGDDGGDDFGGQDDFDSVPEPVSAVLGAMGLGVVSLATRRRMA